MEIVYIIIALAAGIAIGWFVQSGRSQAAGAKADMLGTQLEEARTQIAGLKAENEEQTAALKNEHEVRTAEMKSEQEKQVASLKEEHGRQVAELKAEHEKQVSVLKGEHERQVSELKDEHARQVGAMKAEFKEISETSERTHREQTEALERASKEQLRQQLEAMEKQTKQQLDLMKEQFTTSSEKELKMRTAELSALNTEQLSKILDPLRDRIAQMKEAVEQSRKEQSEAKAALNTAIDRTVEQAEKLGKSTETLVSALAHDNKYQGSFGEMQLRQMLENMGFAYGTQFEEQVTLRDDSGEAILHETTGSRMQPDVVLHFPDKRDIIIDAKTSMNAFLRYKDGTLSEADRQQALKDHLTAIKTQVKSLSKKDYWRQYNQKGIKLDFVVMFVPSEAAFNLATSEDADLWRDAFNQGVFITGPQNLYALLRLLEMSWKQVAQVENQQNIIDCANEIVKRVQLFYERFQKADTALAKTQKCFSELKTTLAPSGKSIINSANKLIGYGAHEDTSKGRALPREDGTTKEIYGDVGTEQ